MTTLSFNSRIVILFALLTSCGMLDRYVASQGPEPTAAEQARTVFKKRCVSCHNQSQARGGLDMTTTDSIMSGSTSGAVVVPGKPAESLLFVLAAHLEAPKMPPNASKIPERELKAIANWINSLPQGLPTQEGTAAMNGQAIEPATRDAEFTDGLVSIDASPGPLCITALSSSQSLLAVSGFHQVLLYDTGRSEWIGALNFPEGDVLALKFSIDGELLVAAGGVGGLSGSVVAWDMKTHHRVQTIDLEDDVALAMDLTDDGRLLAVAGPKRSIEVFDLSNGARKHTLKKHADWVTSLAFSRDGVLLASGDRFGSVYLWDVHAGAFFDQTESHAGMITSLHFSQDSNQLWSTGKDGYIKQSDLQKDELVRQFLVSPKGIADMLVVQDQAMIIDSERRLTTWNKAREPALVAELQQDGTRCTAIDVRGELLVVVGDWHSSLHIYKENGELVRTLAIPSIPSRMSVAKFIPKPVERQLQAAKFAGDKSAATEPLEQSALVLAKRSLAASRELIEQTRKTLNALESEQRALEELVKLLETSP